MTPYKDNDDVLRELWAIKAQTAQRFKTVDAYFAHLRSAAPLAKPSATAKNAAPKPKRLAAGPGRRALVA